MANLQKNTYNFIKRRAATGFGESILLKKKYKIMKNKKIRMHKEDQKREINLKV